MSASRGGGRPAARPAGVLLALATIASLVPCGGALAQDTADRSCEAEYSHTRRSEAEVQVAIDVHSPCCRELVLEHAAAYSRWIELHIQWCRLNPKPYAYYVAMGESHQARLRLDQCQMTHSRAPLRYACDRRDALDARLDGLERDALDALLDDLEGVLAAVALVSLLVSLPGLIGAASLAGEGFLLRVAVGVGAGFVRDAVGRTVGARIGGWIGERLGGERGRARGERIGELLGGLLSNIGGGRPTAASIIGQGGGRPGAAGAAGLTEAEQALANEAKDIISSSGFHDLRRMVANGEENWVQFGGRYIQNVPNGRFSGFTDFEQNGFAMGREAWVSEEETVKTILHELHRLSTSSVAEGLTQAQVTAETKAAQDFANRAFNAIFRRLP